MQIRVWGTPQENTEIINLLKRELKDKIKMISSPYLSKNNKTQRIYIEIDLQNQNYRKHPTQENETNITLAKQFIQSAKSENTDFDENTFFEEIEKRINQNC